MDSDGDPANGHAVWAVPGVGDEAGRPAVCCRSWGFKVGPTE